MLITRMSSVIWTLLLICIRISVILVSQGFCQGRNRSGCHQKRPGRQDHTFSGHSGVGKSTLINAILPGTKVKTGEISTYHNKGMHTTTFSEMFSVDGDGYIIDTPGIKGFGTFDMEEEEIGHYFPEIFKVSLIANMVTVHIGCRDVRCVRQWKSILSVSLVILLI